jgi:hypothetical protein
MIVPTATSLTLKIVFDYAFFRLSIKHLTKRPPVVPTPANAVDGAASACTDVSRIRLGNAKN